MTQRARGCGQVYVNFIWFFFNDTATTEIYTLSLHDALPIWPGQAHRHGERLLRRLGHRDPELRSEEHTSELQSRFGISYAVFRLKKDTTIRSIRSVMRLPLIQDSQPRHTPS